VSEETTMTISRILSLLSLAALTQAGPSQAQELQRTTLRVDGISADATASSTTDCEQSSLAVYAFDSVRRYGPAGETQAERSVTIIYHTINWCEGTRLELNTQLPAPDANLPSTLDTASVTLAAPVRVRRCSFSGTIRCENVTVPLTLQAVWSGDPALYAVSRQRSVRRMGPVFMTSRSRDRLVAADVELSLQVDGHTALTNNISAYLRHTRDGEITIQELPSDPEG
jgi:hypothetical protein